MIWLRITPKYWRRTNNTSKILSNYVSKHTDDIQQKTSEKKLKLDEIEQHDRQKILSLLVFRLKIMNKWLKLCLISVANFMLTSTKMIFQSRIASQWIDAAVTGRRTRHPANIVRFISRYKRNELYDNRYKIISGWWYEKSLDQRKLNTEAQRTVLAGETKIQET